MLPILAFVLALSAIAAFATIHYEGLRQTSVHGRGVRFHSHGMDVTVPPNKFWLFSLSYAAGRNAWWIQTANMPGIMIEMAMSGVMRTWPESWRPAIFGPGPVGLFGWRAVCFPFYGLPFWWFAGFGVDALLLRRRLRWPTLLFGTLLFCFFTIIAVGVTFGSDHDGATPYFMSGIILWYLLMLSFPLAWIRSRRAASEKRNISN